MSDRIILENGKRHLAGIGGGDERILSEEGKERKGKERKEGNHNRPS